MATTRASNDTTVKPTTTRDAATATDTTVTDNNTEAPQKRTLEQKTKDGDLLPSDYEAIGRQYGLTRPETERLVSEGTLSDSAADTIRGERVIYRAAYEQVRNSPASAAPAFSAGPSEADKAAEEKAKKEHQEAVAAATAPTLDRTQPEAGPYGPFAPYTKVEVGALEASSETDLTVDQAKDRQSSVESKEV